MKYIKQGLSNWTNPSGRSSRAEYWSTVIALNIFNIFLIFINETLYSFSAIATVIISISLGIRRMHDAGVAGWYLLIPIANIVMAFSSSKPYDNKWGPVPTESSLNSNKSSEPIKNNESSQNSVDELEELEQRLIDLKELKKEKDEKDNEKEMRKNELLKEIEELRRELDE